MVRTRTVGTSLVVLAYVLLLAPAAWAQQASGIAGVVRDTTGGVLPGVTVEAASPALIEKVRSAVTDGQGRYNIVELRPGIYTVTFTLPGFNIVRREGVELTSGFTATINAELRVGALEETVTVTGASPLVDVQNVRQQRLVTHDTLATLPSSSMTLSNIGAITPGIAGTINVGGAAGLYSMSSANTMVYHGKANAKTNVDGMRINNAVLGSSTGYIASPGTLGEWVLDTGGASAESSASGVGINYIPKEGGNSFSGVFSGLYTNDQLQSNNLDEDLRARGLTTPNNVLYVFDNAASVGGPIKQDKLWFFTSHRAAGNKNQVAGIFFNKTQGTPFYTPDLDRPAFRNEHIHSHAVRLTWQASPANKLNFFTDIQDNCVCRGRGEFAAPEAAYEWGMWPQGVAQFTWISTLSSKLLVEAAAGVTVSHWPTFAVPESKSDHISIFDLSSLFRYNSLGFGLNGQGKPKDSDRYTQKFSVSYVTGSHNFKTGVYLEETISNTGYRTNHDIQYNFFGRRPFQVLQFATPFVASDRIWPDLGLYAQDQWTIDRLTLNLGVRFDYLRGYVPEQHVPAVQFLPARDFDRVDNVPEWTDINPRLGASYDLFGDGRTAIKVTLGRYVNAVGTFDFSGIPAPSNVNPLFTSVNAVARSWNDTNGNFVPDCNLRSAAANGECGPYNEATFGTPAITTRFADDLVHGSGVRPSFWDFATEVQHELAAGVSVTAGYYRNWHANFIASDNLDVTRADYDPFCITAPVDARLPGGGGYQVCGLADITPAKFGRRTTLVQTASNFGERTRVSDFFNVSIHTRLTSGIQFGGGVDTGRTVNDQCFVVDSPQDLLYCRVVTPFKAQTQVKFFGSYPFPGGFFVSGTFQSMSGESFGANYPASNAEIAPSLGRNLAGGLARVAVALPLVAPQTLFLPRRNQLDLRLSKRIPLGARLRLEANVDVYNVFNANDVNRVNNTYGSQWLRPISDSYAGGAILDGRLVEFGGRLTF